LAGSARWHAGLVAEPEATTRRWWTTKPFLIIMVAGCFHLGRGAPIDGVVFLATATAIGVVERTRPGPPAPRKVPAAAVLVAVPLGWLVASRPPDSVAVTVAVALAGPPMLLLALRTGGHTDRVKAGRWWPWAAVGVATCLWELTSFLQQSDPATANRDHPTLSAVLDPLLAAGPGRTVAIIGWLAVGGYLVRLMLAAPRCAR